MARGGALAAGTRQARQPASEVRRKERRPGDRSAGHWWQRIEAAVTASDARRREARTEPLRPAHRRPGCWCGAPATDPKRRQPVLG